MLLKEDDRALERVVRIEVARARTRLGDRPPDLALLVRHVDRQDERLLGEPLGGFELACARGARRLHAPDDREVVRIRPGAEEELGLVDVHGRGAQIRRVDQCVRAVQVCACEVQCVLRRLQQRDRAAEVLERHERLRLLLGELAVAHTDAAGGGHWM